MKRNKLFFIAGGTTLASGVSFLFFGATTLAPVVYEQENFSRASVTQETEEGKKTIEPVSVATHISTPESLKAIYMTSWVAGTSGWRSSLVDMIEKTELNAVVIDIKDYTGRIAFKVSDPLLQKTGAQEVRIPDIGEFIELLHEKEIYVIGRITVFQDPYYAKKYPNLAVKKESDPSVLWEDYKGLYYLDPGAKDVWDYMVALGKESYSVGFDELNFDYIRFPSDGDMKDLYFPFSEERINKDWRYGKAKIVRDFFAYLHENLKDTGVVLSADLFGMVTTNSDDLNIGQVMEYAAPYFDFIAPMTYPSHYPKGFNGWTNPNEHVYEIIKYSLDSAVRRALSSTTPIAELGYEAIPRVSTTSPQLYKKITFDPKKLRPWLQDFDYGGNYDAEEVRAQIQAVYDAGLSSWMLWDPANRYTRDALVSE